MQDSEDDSEDLDAEPDASAAAVSYTTWVRGRIHLIRWILPRTHYDVVYVGQRRRGRQTNEEQMKQQQMMISCSTSLRP